MNGQKAPLQFSILRLAIALGVFGIPFAFLVDPDVSDVMVAAGIGGALAILVLNVGRANQARILNLLAFAVISGVFWGLLGPRVTMNGEIRPTERIQTVQRLISGAMVGSLVGLIWNLFAVNGKRKGE
jgi:hypothetical protein